ncbi:hypothetical protein D9M68_908280 [compost metagenome]
MIAKDSHWCLEMGCWTSSANGRDRLDTTPSISAACPVLWGVMITRAILVWEGDSAEIWMDTCWSFNWPSVVSSKQIRPKSFLITAVLSTLTTFSRSPTRDSLKGTCSMGGGGGPLSRNSDRQMGRSRKSSRKLM